MPETNIEVELYDFHRKRVEYWVGKLQQRPADASGCFEATPDDEQAFIEREAKKFGCSNDIMAAAVGYAYKDWLLATKHNS